jgi:hypothetical protein
LEKSGWITIETDPEGCGGKSCVVAAQAKLLESDLDGLETAVRSLLSPEVLAAMPRPLDEVLSTVSSAIWHPGMLK